LVEELTKRIVARLGQGTLLVAVDGVDGAGKTRLADDLDGAIGKRGPGVVRASIDGFHRPRIERYRQGKDSPRGFYEDSFDLDLLKRVLLDPLAGGGPARIRVRAFDHRSDRPVDEPELIVDPPAILVFDGIFLQRPELRQYWDLTIFLDVPFAESYRRMAVRDGSDPDPEAESNRRYYEGQKLYFEECRPQERADVLVDYADIDGPRVVRG
jgi:uridine kinase